MAHTSGGVRAVVLRSKCGERSPSTTNVQQAVSRLEVELLAHHRELVVLQLLERLHAVDVLDDARGVDHPRAEEPGVEVVAAVVVVPDLFLVLGLRVDDNVGYEIEEDVFEELHESARHATTRLRVCFRTIGALGAVPALEGEVGEADETTHGRSELERSPVMSVLHHVQDVPLELDLAVKVRIVEHLHRDLLAPVFVQRRRLDLEVRLLGLVGQRDLLIETTAKLGGERPVGDGDGDEDDGEDDEIGCPSGLEGDETLNEPRREEVGRRELVV